MPTITAMPIMKRKALVISLVWAVWRGISWAEEASAKMTAKKNNTAAATAPRTVIAFTIRSGVTVCRFKLNPCLTFRSYCLGNMSNFFILQQR